MSATKPEGPAAVLSPAVKRVTARTALAAVVVLAAGWLLVLALDISVPFDAFRTPIEATLSRSLGQAVSIKGPITVRPTLGPSVTVRDLRIAGYPGGAGMELLRAGQVDLRLELLSLVRGRPRITRLEARDVTVNRMDMDAHQGRPADARDFGEAATADWPAQLELSLHNLTLNYRTSAMEAPLRLVFEQVRGSVVPDQALQLAVAGWLGAFPYSADLTLPPPARFARPGVARPLQASVELAGTRLLLRGTLTPPAAGQEVAIMHLDLQDDGPAAADAAPEGTGPALAGTLMLHIKGGRPHVGGELRLASLDMERLAAQFVSGTVPAGAALSVPGWLGAVDAALVVSIDTLGNAPLAVRDTRVNLVLSDGQLNAPLEMTIAGVPFHGSVLLEPQAEQPELALSLAAADIDAATLLYGLPVFAGVQGNVARIELHAVAPVTGKRSGLNGLDAGVQVSNARLTYGNVESGTPVQVTLDTMALSVPANSEVTMTVDGALRNVPFSVGLTGGSLAALLQEQAWPLSLSATGSGATLTASGALAAFRGSGDTTFNLQASGERLGDLAPWLGVSVCATIPYTVRGQLVLANNIGRLQFLKVQLGGTQLNGELDWSRDEQVPLLHAVLFADMLDPADVEGLLPVLSYTAGEGAARGIRLDVPVLPRPAVLGNADINLNVAQIAHRLVELAEVSFSGRLRDGVFQRSPFSARIGSRVLRGQLDTSGADTSVAFAVSTADAAAGGLLDRLFSSAVQWVGNAGVVPLRWFFGRPLSGMVGDGCQPASAGM